MKHLGFLFVLIFMCSKVAAQANVTRTLSGVIVTQQDELLLIQQSIGATTQSTKTLYSAETINYCKR